MRLRGLNDLPNFPLINERQNHDVGSGVLIESPLPLLSHLTMHPPLA